MRKIIAFAAAVEILAVTALAVNVARSYAGTQQSAARAQVSQSIDILRPANPHGFGWMRG
jgi:hypothetical protein